LWPGDDATRISHGPHVQRHLPASGGSLQQGNAPYPPDWLPKYLKIAYEPTATDFRRLRKHVKQYRRIYETNYRDVRHQYYAHKQAAEPNEVAALFPRTNIREMQRLFVFLLQLHQALQQLFLNGTKPVLRRFRYSAQRIKRRPSPAIPGDAVHERITMEAEQALLGTSQTKVGRITTQRSRRSRVNP
jgi:hypothetical protein